MRDLILIGGGFLLGMALMGFLNERRIRRVREDARALVEQDNKRRYGT